MEENNPLISIIIPTFNRCELLQKAIDSILAQTCRKWELIIIDDGSTDNTSVLLESYKDNRRIKSYYQDNQGVSIARNYGVKKSTGDYIIFLDSDDIFYPDLIQTLYNFNFENYDFICWQVKKVIDGKEKLWKAKKLGGMYNFLNATFFPGSICYKKQIFINAGGFDPKIKFGENYELGMRVSEQPDLKVKLINREFLLYDIQSSNRESNTYQNRIPSHFHQLRKHLNKYNRYPSEKSELLYIIGYQLENQGKKKGAIILYRKAFHIYPFRLKYFLKLIHFWIFK